MLHSTAIVATETPRRYLVQLCKHFEHRLDVAHSENAGSIAFPAGTCRLEAATDTLILHADADTQEALTQVQDVVARHLLRFAFRAPPDIVWALDAE